MSERTFRRWRDRYDEAGLDARAIDGAAGYCLAPKRNQSALFEDVRLWLDDPRSRSTTPARRSTAITAVSSRRALLVEDVAWLENHGFQPSWGLAAVAKVTAVRDIDGKSTTASRSHLLSKLLDAAHLAEVVRTPWNPAALGRTGSTGCSTWS